jgi:hypothetical protein
MRTEVQNVLNYGTPVCIKYFNVSGGSAVYDDNKVLTQSGTDFWTTGFNQELSSRKGSNEAQLVEEGRLLFNDSRLYLIGTVPTSGIMRVGIGSPTPQQFQVLFEGVAQSPVFDTTAEVAYKLLYVRFLKNGSLMGE